MESAKVSSIDALRSFRAALIKFAESADSAIMDADADVRSTLIWLERDQITYWQGQIRKRHDLLERAREALRHKELFKSPHGGRASVVDEQKAVAKAKAALEEAEQKLINVKKSIQRLQKQMSEFQGQVQRLATSVQTDIPTAVADLDRMVALLDQYVALHSPVTAASAADKEAGEMSRAALAEARQQPDWNSLRSRTPSPATRAGVAPGLIAFGPWKSGEIKITQKEALAALDLSRVPVQSDQIIILARDVNDNERIYLERMDPAFPDDSGWYIGPAHAAGPPKLLALKIEQVLAMRPDFADIISLPPGYLLGMDEGGIAALLNAQDRDVWQEVRLSTQVPIDPPTEQ